MGKLPHRRKTSKVFSRLKTLKVTPKTTITQKLKRTLKKMYGHKMKVIDSDKQKHKQKHKQKFKRKRSCKGKKKSVSFSNKAVQYSFSKGSIPSLIKHSMAVEKRTK